MLKRANDNIIKILSTLSMLTIVGLTAVVAIQVVTRLLKISLPWTEELARFLLIWLTFIGCSLAIEKKMHLSVNFFVNLAPAKIRLIIGLFIYSIMIVFFGVIAIYGFKLTILSFNTLSSSLQWPMGVVYVVLPLTSIVSIYFTLIELVDFYKKGGAEI